MHESESKINYIAFNFSALTWRVTVQRLFCPMIGGEYSADDLLPMTSQSTQRQQKLLPSRFDQLLHRLGQELSCAICLGIMVDPSTTPCHHAFCKQCLDRLLRVAGKSEAPCPVCKLRISRRSIRTDKRWVGLVEAFTNLAAEHERLAGRTWDSLPSEEEDDQYDDKMTLKERILFSRNKSSSIFTSMDDPQSGSLPSSPQIERLKSQHEQLTRDLVEIDHEISKRAPCEESDPLIEVGEINKPSSSIIFGSKSSSVPLLGDRVNPTRILENIQLPSSPEDLFCRLPTQQLIQSQSISGTCNMHVIATSLIRSNDPFMKILSQFASTFPTRVSLFTAPISQFTNQVTHLITPANSARIGKRTLKYLLSILNGLWIVSPEWVELCLETGRMVDESYFELAGDEYFPDEDAPKRGRFSRNNRESPLFHGHLFYLYGRFGAPSKDDLSLLIREAGGVLIEDVKELDHNSQGRRRKDVHVICDPAEQADFEKDAGVIAKFKPLISSTWLLDCISAFQLIDPSTHIVL